MSDTKDELGKTTAPERPLTTAEEVISHLREMVQANYAPATGSRPNESCVHPAR